MVRPIPRAPLVIVAGSTVWQAVGTVAIARVISPETSTLAAFLAFGAAAAFCVAQAAVSRSVGSLVRLASDRRVLRLLLCMNAATAGVFVTFYAALAYLPPLAVSVLEAGSAPFIVAVVVGLRREGSLGRAAAMPALVGVLSIVIAGRAIGLDRHHGSESWVGVALAVAAGISGAAVALLSGALHRSGLTVVQVNASRFHLAWIVSGSVFFLGPGHEAGDVDLLGLVLISVSLGGLPLVALQYGLSRARPVSAELVMSSLPALVFLADAVPHGRVDLLTSLLLGVVLLISAQSLASSTGIGLRRPRRERSRAALLDEFHSEGDP